MQAGVQLPAAQTGVVPLHCALVVHGDPTGVGSHAPFRHVDPAAHVAPEALQSATQRPSAHTSPAGHSLENWQAFAEAVQAPATQAWPTAHSALFVHAQGPLPSPHVGPESTVAGPPSVVETTVPPSFATHSFATQEYPVPQSAPVVQATGVPGVVPGGTQYVAAQIVPCGHSPDPVQLCAQPVVVQLEPVGQSMLPVHEVVAGGETVLHE